MRCAKKSGRFLLYNKEHVPTSMKGSDIKMKVILSADHAGVTIRNEVKQLLDDREIDYEDTGCSCEASGDYPGYALPAAARAATGESDYGIIICATCGGMSCRRYRL